MIPSAESPACALTTQEAHSPHRLTGPLTVFFATAVGVIVMNASEEHFLVTRGMRIAQAVLAPVFHAMWDEVEDLDATARGAGGFGSTGH